MVQIVLLVLGIIAAIRLPRLIKIAPTDYPGVDPALFEKWRSVERASAIWLIVATIGVFLLQLGGGFVMGAAMAASHSTKAQFEHATMVFTVVTVGLFLVLLVVAAVLGSKAKTLRTEAGITWPKK